ncbi:hypothetical protein Kpol_1025p13 [Vanderwaltozyma polyspora DSM 70294]|uniref:RING-type domain-containing protein n=1 Tax=Vanderwaltozyma polyspora (strain ATCC 22028 / DSM 70294 / BCRC 21397 / CBS 2163 / NBRC 10782 / NRRL Y-8283 / UCD 57-17) TaxID=436907 RepID=A7TKT9_VANPO|nr:uncharacterized protein Kpol_1025p13 [Vanderwaltozyma polyspora DSM 70294]EDO17094.1 hypothetical protein Kpol_1025p13 [Vanderwaltozyma polyspora DSM 70294]
MSNSSMENALDGLNYLKQTDQFLITNNSTLATILNFPYRIGLSFSDATKLQYRQALEAENVYPGFETFMNIVGYFFSNYAVACFITALLLNRFVMMSSLRTNTPPTSLPKWSNILLHFSAILPLVFMILTGFCQTNSSNLLPVLEFRFFLSRCFTVFAWSHCIETFVAITTNTKPLEDSDYTIFELSIQFYLMSKGKNDNPIRLEYISDILMALLGRILIHVVEIFRIRNFRLMGSTILNIGYLSYLGYIVNQYGIGTIPFTTFFRHFPKVFSIFLVLISALCYGLACLVRIDPFGGNTRDPEELQYYTFMNNWWGHLNCTTEQEFTTVIGKLALLLCKGTGTNNNGVQKEFTSLNVPLSIHHSYMVSGYNNENHTLLRSELLKLKLRDNLEPENNTVKSSWKNRIWIIYELFEAFYHFLRSPKKQKTTKQESNIHVPSTVAANSNDLNRYITCSNYAKFLSKSESVSDDIAELLLLPEEDFSADYIPPEDEENWEILSHEKSENNQNDLTESEIDEEDLELISDDDDDDEEDNDVEELEEETLKDQLINLIIPYPTSRSKDEMSWVISMWNMLRYQLKNEKRLTRSEYSNLNPGEVLTEVMAENSTLNHATSNNVHTSKDSNNEDNFESLCVVCKTNDRNIVLWPCRCFALCEDCRISLSLRGFNSCICCRSDVHGYSKLHRV